MSSPKIWLSGNLKKFWEEQISQKAVMFFENLVLAKNAEDFKKKSHHSNDSGIPSKYVSRAAEFLNEVALLDLERQADLLRFRFNLPVVKEPPVNVQRPPWATDQRRSRSTPMLLKKQVYGLDGGYCAYCEKQLSFEESKLDHIYPDSKGGAETPDNLTIACEPCNRKKWYWIPNDVKYLSPKRFRGKRVTSVNFEKIKSRYHPKFTFAD